MNINTLIPELLIGIILKNDIEDVKKCRLINKYFKRLVDNNNLLWKAKYRIFKKKFKYLNSDVTGYTLEIDYDGRIKKTTIYGRFLEDDIRILYGCNLEIIHNVEENFLEFKVLIFGDYYNDDIETKLIIKKDNIEIVRNNKELANYHQKKIFDEKNKITFDKTNKTKKINNLLNVFKYLINLDKIKSIKNKVLEKNINYFY